MTLTPVNSREIAVVITFLEMNRRPKPCPAPISPLQLTRWKTPGTWEYRILFKRVGEPWLWFSRLAMSDHELSAIICDDRVEVYAALDPKGLEIGLLELDFRDSSRCEIAFFGLVQQLSGQGLGRWLMGQALMLAWRKNVDRVTVQTSSIDDPRALAFYKNAGFTPIGRAVQTFDDPRIIGLLSPNAAPHVPLFK